MHTLHNDTYRYQYNLQDFVVQNLHNELLANVVKEQKNNNTDSALEFLSLANEFEHNQVAEVKDTLKFYYEAFNSYNCESVRGFWLQDPTSELILPGNAKAVSTQLLLQ